MNRLSKSVAKVIFAAGLLLIGVAPVFASSEGGAVADVPITSDAPVIETNPAAGDQTADDDANTSGPSGQLAATDTVSRSLGICRIYDDLTHPDFCEFGDTNGLGAITEASAMRGVRSGSGPALLPVDVFDRCRYIDGANANDTDVFAPFQSSTEWMSFINAAEGPSKTIDTYVKLVHCARPTPAADILPAALPNGIPPGTAANKDVMEAAGIEVTLPDECISSGAAPQKVSAVLPYDRTGNTRQAGAVTFTTCTVKGICDPEDSTDPSKCGANKTWTQRARPTYEALDSDVANPSWKLVAVEYSGVVPDPNPAPTVTPIAGRCGSADGRATSSRPTSNLCSRGLATAVTGSGPWSWRCNGVNGGTQDVCNAPLGSITGLGCDDCPSGVIVSRKPICGEVNGRRVCEGGYNVWKHCRLNNGYRGREGYITPNPSRRNGLAYLWIYPTATSNVGPACYHQYDNTGRRRDAPPLNDRDGGSIWPDSSEFPGTGSVPWVIEAAAPPSLRWRYYEVDDRIFDVPTGRSGRLTLSDHMWAPMAPTQYFLTREQMVNRPCANDGFWTPVAIALTGRGDPRRGLMKCE